MAAALSDSGAAAPYVLDTLATVVDASRFLADVAEARGLDEDGASAGEAEGRTLADLLVEQACAWPCTNGQAFGCGNVPSIGYTRRLSRPWCGLLGLRVHW